MEEYKHGTYRMYRTIGCRCELCREANADMCRKPGVAKRLGNSSGPDARWHGTPGGYTNHKCRCQPCKDAWASHVKEYKRKRVEVAMSIGLPPEDPRHGTDYAYHHLCRCRVCKDGHNLYVKQVRARKNGDNVD